MKKLLLIFLAVCLLPIMVKAKSGCCSHHGGVAGCDASGKQICRDGTLSPSCTCAPTYSYVYGCTDKNAKNYNSDATKDDGSCKYYVYGCTDSNAKNYNSNADKDDDSCEYYIYGCTDSKAINYNLEADKDDGSCEYAQSETLNSKTNTEPVNNDTENAIYKFILSAGAIGTGFIIGKKIK